ncbi:lipase member M isoform X2 [Dryobates pubescens]|uniref:lipase member M isoform X2 n=1 Tax=Dryobates pubescens TaxID=118200 RepID=UPI0023B98871|nr:lipase member M isoform X2 [Dryobates pubescens]
MNVSQIIQHQGYPSEEHEVLTLDGYYLTLNRIPHGREDARSQGGKPVVFLQHGILGDGSHWVENLPNNSLGFILADSGYDVWLGNSRGTSWSRRHQRLSADQPDFWDFSFHEMAMFDLPAMISFVLQKTGQKQMYYIGYSQGCTIGFIAFSSLPELAQNIKMFFALAPVATVSHTKGPIMRMSSLLDKQFKMLQFLPRLCGHPLLQKPCANLFFLLGGYNEKNFNMTRLDVYTSHFPDRTSVKNIIHWAQVKKSGEFKAFNYGSANPARYHQDTPPSYRVEEMPVPTAVWSGGRDWVADPEDMERLLPRIAQLVTHRHIPDWNHWDFIWGLDAPRRLYSSILELMEASG